MAKGIFRAYYNEIDPYAAQWLRNLIAAGLIAPGDVDERSIEDVRPTELAGYTQCHFFAGVGVWSHALRTAGWPDDKPAWTGSCPCQPFSAAGKGNGFADERHLWPAFHYLIEQCRPAIVFGEQVASKDAEPWIDLVQDDLEALGYAVGAVPFPSAGVGAPHIRDRLYWVADASDDGLQGRLPGRTDTQRRVVNGQAGRDGAVVGLGYSTGDRSEVRQHLHGEMPGQGFAEGCDVGGLADTADQRQHWRRAGGPSDGRDATRVDTDGDRREAGNGIRLHGTEHDAQHGGGSGIELTGPTNGLWRAADWLLCRDGKWRPVEPGTFPLAHGAPARVGRLRAYGNAINAQAAAAFIEACQ